MVDLGGYVIIIVETKDKKIKLYGSPADKEDLEVGDEILEVNGRSLENVTHTEVISHIHQCIRSRTICLRVKRRSGNKLALDLTTQHSNIQDAFVIAVEQQARDRLEKLSQLKKIKPIDMTKLSHQLSEGTTSNELNGLIKEVTGSPIYITSVPELNQQQHNEFKTSPASSSHEIKSPAKSSEIKPINSTTENVLGIDSNRIQDNSSRKSSTHSELYENGHREMAVDVPDTFIPKNKTQPSYPKNIENNITDKSINQARVDKAERIKKFKEELIRSTKSPVEVAVEPIGKKLQNGTSSSSSSAAATCSAQAAATGGVADPAPVLALAPVKLVETVDSILDKSPNLEIAELISNLQRTQEALNKNGFNNDEIIKPVHKLLLKPEFQKILQIYNKVYNVCCFNSLPIPVSLHLQELVQECISSLYNCSAIESLELINLISKINFENILYAYDKIAEREKLVALSEFNCGESIDEILTRSIVPIPDDTIKIVRIEKTHDPLGATVRNEGDTVVIGRIIKGGMAEKYGLTEGDEILEVNGIEMKGKTINDVCDILSHMTGTLTFLIIPNTITSHEGKSEIMIHVRAQFNYSPKDDIYLPCHELGIFFNKGDILHIINQDDLNWWQAHRDGEEEQLAGLIPSKSFHTQREMLKHNLSELQYENERNNKKSAALLCTKGNKKKRRKVNNLNDDDETIPTYEEVVLYYPTHTFKRPIILIGPPNIGRHELRQRLIQEYSDRFAAAVPHTTRLQKDNEINGQDYYFITRSQFEFDINASKFIEYGEFEKSYYGTSIDSIKLIISINKTCIINLHPQSIKLIRSQADLRPYIIFIAPASLDRLKEIRILRGEAYKEDELIEIIESANKMESKYGHYFDFIIINNDLEHTYYELIQHINYIEHKLQWVPASWAT